MGFRTKYLSKFYFKQWTIGIAEESIHNIIRNKKQQIDFKWLMTGNKMQSYADPFVTFNPQNNEVVILAEQFTTGQFNGKIAAINYTKEQGFAEAVTIISNGSHLSYPLVYSENGKSYIIAENAYNHQLNAYEYNPETKEVGKNVVISDKPLIDATILKKDGKYWLFASMLGEGVFDELDIYMSDSLLGPYEPHQLNPVKKNLNGSRPAGSFIEVDGAIYRPSQNCKAYYGHSITIHKLSKLSLTEFEEEEYMQIDADKYQEFNLGVHTINGTGNYLVVDAQKGHFQPIQQIIRFFRKILLKAKTKV